MKKEIQERTPGVFGLIASLLQFGEDATYDGTLFWKRKVASIRLAVTPFGKSVGCNETVELKSARSRASWADFPIDSKRVGGPGKSEGEIDPSHFNGRVVINNQAYVGSYSLQQLFPGAALMHLVSVSQDAVDGHEVQQEISALVAGLSVHRPILRDTNHFHFVRLDPGASSCLARSSRLKNKIIQ